MGFLPIVESYSRFVSLAFLPTILLLIIELFCEYFVFTERGSSRSRMKLLGLSSILLALILEMTGSSFFLTLSWVVLKRTV